MTDWTWELLKILYWTGWFNCSRKITLSFGSVQKNDLGQCRSCMKPCVHVYYQYVKYCASVYQNALRIYNTTLDRYGGTRVFRHSDTIIRWSQRTSALFTGIQPSLLKPVKYSQTYVLTVNFKYFNVQFYFTSILFYCIVKRFWT